MPEQVEEGSKTRISAEMQAAVGSEVARAVSYPVSESDIRRWALAVYYPEEPPARYWDQEAARRSRYGGIVAPEDFNPFAWMRAEPKGVQKASRSNDPDNTEKSIGIEGPHLANQLNGGITVEYGVPIRPGDVISSVTTLGQYTERMGSLGLMLFTPMEAIWINQHGEMVKKSTMMLIRY